jgi:hypothetical protein
VDYVALASGLSLPWLFGLSILLALDWPRAGLPARADRGGTAALRLGYGYFIGALLLTLWMRALSIMEIRFGWIAIGVPLLVGTGMFLGVAARRGRLETAAVRATLVALMRPPTLRGLHTWVWWLLIAWLALRFALLAAEVAWQPLYPWDAWVQWATKARVWYEFGRIVPFVGADIWLSDTSGAYFDASPNYPATIPLLQVWSCIALGRWDDSAMNWPWLLTLIALTLGVYGALRDSGLPSLGALVGGFLVASLPLVDVHVALAGYADLMAAAMYALAALALHRWTLHRDPRDAGIAIALALACPMLQPIGIVWALTLLPGVIVALLPRRGIRLVAAAFGVAALAILALGQSETMIFGYRLHLEFQRPWQSLIDSYLLFANWHLLWYCAVALALLGAPRLVRAPLAPLGMVVASGLGVVFFVAAYPDTVARTVGFTTLNRAALQLAPLLVCVGVLLWREITATPAAPARAATGAPVSAAADA